MNGWMGNLLRVNLTTKTSSIESSEKYFKYIGGKGMANRIMYDEVPVGTDPAAYAGDALALLDELGIDRAVVIGQSMGGWTGVELALAAPERVAGLVLACTTGSLSFDGFVDAELSRWRETSTSARTTR